MKIYIRAYWYDEGESADDFIYKPDGSSNTDYEEEDELYEVLPDDPYEGSTGYGDFDDYELYDYSEYEDFYNQVKKRKIYVPLRVTKDIPDYNAYRKALFGTLYLSLQSGETIETLYEELCKSFPGLMKDYYINDADMLLEIVDTVLYAQSILKP